MSLRDLGKQWHTVTVEDGTATFACEAKYAPCHFYPECDCESWTDDHYAELGVGHEPVWHDECWMQPFFDNGYGYAVYAGEDAENVLDDSWIPEGMNRTGPIVAEWADEYIEWWFVS